MHVPVLIRSRLVIFSILSLIAISAIVWYFLGRQDFLGFDRVPNKDQSVPQEYYSSPEYGIAFSYPSVYVEDALDASDEEALIFFRALREENEALISVRRETGLGILQLQGGTIFDGLVAAVNRRYPDRFPEYKKENYEELVIANEQAALFDFTYTGTDGSTRIKQRLYVVVRGSEAYYVSFQIVEDFFDEYVTEFEEMVASVEFL